MTIIKDEGKVTVPESYEEKYQKAFLTFKFQRVYCPQRKKLVTLNEIEECAHGSELSKMKDTNFLGK